MGSSKGYANQDCSLAAALDIIGEKWTLLVLRDCFYGVRRFNDFHAHLDIPRAVLTTRLKRLIDAGLLERRQRGSEHEYRLTDSGLKIWPVIYAVAQWGEAQLAPQAGPRRVFSHAACGVDLDPSGSCPRCGKAPGPDELEIRHGPGANRDLRDDPVTRALAIGPHRLLTRLETAAGAATA